MAQSTEERRQANLARLRVAYYRDIEASRVKSRIKTAKVRAERIPWINAIKLENGCVDCGYREHPAALQFDHRDRATKLFTIAKGLTRSKRAILAEIAKCDVRCANCHVVRSVQEGHLGRPRIEALLAAGHAVPYMI